MATMYEKSIKEINEYLVKLGYKELTNLKEDII